MRTRFSSLRAALNPSCREAARLAAESHRFPPGFVHRLGFLIHLCLCAFCRRFQGQVQHLRAHGDHPPPLPDTVPSPEARRRWQARLDAAAAAIRRGGP